MLDRFTLIIPTFDRPHKVRRALESVLSQDKQPEQIIIVDDGSQQSLPLEMVPPHVRVVRHETNLGAAAARNTGMREAATDWVTFLDDDDRLLPGSLAARAALIDPDDITAIHGCAWRVTSGEDRQLGWLEYPQATRQKQDFYLGCWFSPGSCVFLNRNAAIAAAGFLAEELGRFEDYDWFCRLGDAGFRLETSAIHGVEIERRRDLDLPKARRNAAIVRRFALERGISRASRRRLEAYLDYELAASAYHEGSLLQTSAYLARSLIRLPRLGLHPAHALRSIEKN